MNTLLLGVYLVGLYLVWVFMWKKTTLDACRDQLFDLRDNLRMWYLDSGRSLEDPTYQNLRKMLNAHIAFTEQLTLGVFIAKTLAFDDNRELMDRKRKDIDRMLASNDDEVNKFVTQIRKKASLLLISYMLESSALFMVIFLTALPFLVAYDLAKWGYARFHSTAREINAYAILKPAAAAALIFAVSSRAGLIENGFDGSVIEEYSITETV